MSETFDLESIVDSVPDKGEDFSILGPEKELSELQQKRLQEREHIATLFRAIKSGVGLKYDPDQHIPMMLEHIGLKGKSYRSLAFRIGVNNETLIRWEKKYPEWKEAKEIAQCGRLNFIEDKLSDLAEGKAKGNAAAAIFYAKNACPDEFKDKRELEVQGGITYVIDTGIPRIENVESDQHVGGDIEADYRELNIEVG